MVMSKARWGEMLMGGTWLLPKRLVPGRRPTGRREGRAEGKGGKHERNF